jgi:phosphoserine phosphatase
MTYVLTVIGAPGSRTLDSALLDAARDALAAAGAIAGPTDWLNPGDACDIPFESSIAENAEAAVRDRLGDAPVDLMAQARDGRRKSLLLADMESTIIAQEMIDELAEAAGTGEQVAKLTARTMAGELDFAEALRARVALIEGLPVTTLDEAATRVTFNPGALTLVRTMRANGAYTALVSGGFTHFLEPVREACGFHEARGNRLLTADGRLTGGVAEPILGPDAKQAALLELAEQQGLTPADACAVGDGANDLDMVQAAGLGVGYRAKPLLREAARVAIDHGDLTALLFLQGYRSSEFQD